MWESDPESLIDQLIKDNDDCVMPIPGFETQPHLLISKVRKHYMEYIIKLLSTNYENHHMLVNKNIYLPSAIWRCAKSIELQAAQSCMVAQLYRKNIMNVITQLKNDNKTGKLHRNLYECLHKVPQNEKKLQVNLSKSTDCTCQCTCELRKKCRITMPDSTLKDPTDTNLSKKILPDVPKEQLKISVLSNHQIMHESPFPYQNPNKEDPIQTSNNSPKRSTITTELQTSDDLMSQLEKLFHTLPNDEDIFDSSLGIPINNFIIPNDKFKQTKETLDCDRVSTNKKQGPVIENFVAQNMSLDERLASLTGLLATNTDNTTNTVCVTTSVNDKNKRRSNKWLCEEYFLKSRLYELFDQIGENDRKKLEMVKEMLYELFGGNGDDEGAISPLEETVEFVASCKERIAPWIVKLLMPYYNRGRIKGKALFKSLAKHLIKIIYQSKRYPSESEVNHFVSDFLQNHKMIRCEADFKTFQIYNI